MREIVEYGLDEGERGYDGEEDLSWEKYDRAGKREGMGEWQLIARMVEKDTWKPIVS